MRDHFHLIRTGDGSDIRENFWARGGRGIERSVLEVLQRLNRILRSLSYQVVAHTVIPIQEEHRGDLETTAERVQQATGYIALSVATLGGLGAVHSHIELRIIKRLLYARIGDARHTFDFLQHPSRDFAIALNIGSLDLNIDGSGQTKVQHLSNDVRGQEVKGRAGIFAGQRLSQALNIICCSVVIFVEGHQNIGVARSDEARGAVHEIDGAVRQPNIVQDVVHFALGDLAADGALNEVAKLGGFFDASTALGTEMQDELTAVGVRKEILTEPRDEEEGRSAGQKKDGYKKQSPVDQRCE